MARFPFKPPPLTRVMDSDKVITTRDKKRLSRTITHLEKRFPQITISFCVVLLPDGVDGRQFGYWLLNRCAPSSALEAKRRLHHLLILVDRNNETVSASVGYGLDCFLDDVTLCKAFHQAKHSYIHDGYVEGSIQWLNIIRGKLLAIHEEVTVPYNRRCRIRNHHAPENTSAISEECRENKPTRYSSPPDSAQSSPRQESPPEFVVTTRP